MPKSDIFFYYSRKDVQKALLQIVKSREVVGVYPSGNFDTRPNIIAYPEDIMQMVRKGIVAFHGSLELWSNPMSLSTSLTIKDTNKLRTGWDLIIDPDCPDFELSKLATNVIIEALKDHGIKNVFLKSTGGKGFHIGLPFHSFPKVVNNKPISELYPELPRKIINYIRDYAKDMLKDEMLGVDTVFGIAGRVGKKISDIVDSEGFDPLKVVEIDSNVVSPRHLFRLPYSLHEGSELVSLPLKISQLDKFQKEDSNPKKVKVESGFLTERVKELDATGLAIEALDWSERHKREEMVMSMPRVRSVRKFGKQYFPDCILKILEGGLQDGRKRSVFILITFLRNMGWEWEEIEVELEKWNEKNVPPLPSNYIKTQLRWHKNQKRNILPPNCDRENFYKAIGVKCMEHATCEGRKNPVNYPYMKLKKR